MSNTPTVYVFCDANCKFEGMTKEQILNAIAQAIKTGTVGDCDTGFITTIKTINGQPLKFFVGEQSEYETLTAEDKENLFAIITNDTTKEGLNSKLREIIDWTNDLYNELAITLYTAVDRRETIWKGTVSLTTQVPKQDLCEWKSNAALDFANIEVFTKHHGVIKLSPYGELDTYIQIEENAAVRFYSPYVDDDWIGVELLGNLRDSENHPFVIYKVTNILPDKSYD